MSDVQGAEDTASGGLVNDMPGIGNAPASPRMVPSALGGLAQFAQQALGIGRPAPRAPGPGRSPFQFPGQSQIPVPPGGGAGDRWQGTTASLLLPKGSPQPEGKFTPYIGTVPTNDYTKWGQPEDYPNLPRSQEIPGLYSKLGQFFSQQGGMSSPWGLLLAGHANAYIKGVMQGQEFRAKMERDKAINAGLQLQEMEEKRHRLIGEIIGKYATEGGTTDPAKLSKFAIRGVTLNDALHQYAIENNDPDIRQMTEDGVGIGKIWDYQKWRDANLKDLQKTNQKATEQEEEDKGWREENQGTGGAKPSSPGDPFSLGAQGAGQSVTPEGAPAPQQTPPAADPFLAGDKPSPDAQNVEGQQPQYDPIDAAADAVNRGVPIDQIPKGEDRGRILARATKQQAAMDALADRAKQGDMSEDQVYNALHAISPATAQTWKRTLHGAPIPGGWSQVGSRPYWQTIQNLAVAVKPGWLPQDADAIKKFTESYTTQPMTQVYVRSGRMGSAAMNLLQATNRAIADGTLTDNSFVNKWKAFKNNKLSDNDASWGIFNAAQTYVIDALTVANGGKPFEGDVRRLMDEQFYMTGPRAIYRILQQDAVAALGVVEPLEDDFVRARERHSPHYEEKSFDILKGITHLQSDGTFGGADVPPELKALERQPGYKLPPGVTITPLP